jgi:hypothetical protein
MKQYDIYETRVGDAMNTKAVVRIQHHVVASLCTLDFIDFIDFAAHPSK